MDFPGLPGTPAATPTADAADGTAEPETSALLGPSPSAPAGDDANTNPRVVPQNTPLVRVGTTSTPQDMGRSPSGQRPPIMTRSADPTGMPRAPTPAAHATLEPELQTSKRALASAAPAPEPAGSMRKTRFEPVTDDVVLTVDNTADTSDDDDVPAEASSMWSAARSTRTDTADDEQALAKIRVRTMFGMVEEISVATGAADALTRVLYLTNMQAQLSNPRSCLLCSL